MTSPARSEGDSALPELVPLSEIRPSTYNPRSTDPARLDLIELSIRKAGWLFPLYVTRSGEILSGHQRHLVAERMNLDRVPVEWVDDLPLDKRKAVNILFNRATNEMRRNTTTGQLRAALERGDVIATAEKLPDTDDPFPCMNVEQRPVRPLVEGLGTERNEYGTAVTGNLWQIARAAMPVLVDSDGHIFNGVGRVRWYLHKHRATCPVVELPVERAAIAAELVNKVSMDFDINERYADMLRYNSFRRPHMQRKHLGRGFLTELPRGRATDFDVADRRDRQRWVAAYGDSVVDFGAGLFLETEMLRRAGVHVSAFEPYTSGPDKKVSTAASRESSRAFLEDVAAGTRWTTVFCSSVLNSVPFREDREHVAVILAALAYPDATMHATARDERSPDYVAAIGGEYHSTAHKNGRFLLDYEDGITVGSLHDKPKVQKYHSPREFHDLFGPWFADVTVRRDGHGNVTARCRQPHPPDRERLAAALDFEFELPMPDGDALGLSAEARAAFTARLDALE